MRTIRTLFVALTAAAAISLLAAPLAAQTTDADSSRSFVVLTGRIDIVRGEVFQDAVIFDGDATVDGQIVRNVVAFNGDVTVSGTVGENVVALNGRVTLGAGARVGGDVVSSDPAVISEGASVGGQVTSKGLPTDFSVGRYVTISRVAIWFATSLSSLALGLLLLVFAPRAGEAVARTASDRFGGSVGIGFAVFFGLPIAAFIAFVTIVGIPLGFGILLALALLFWIGYVSAALAIGRLLVKPPTSRLLAFLAGWAILRVVAIVPGLGGIAWFLATVFGLGALAVAARAAGRPRADEQVGGGAVAMPPPPPMPRL
jgi:hypothetical protein